MQLRKFIHEEIYSHSEQSFKLCVAKLPKFIVQFCIIPVDFIHVFLEGNGNQTQDCACQASATPLSYIPGPIPDLLF